MAAVSEAFRTLKRRDTTGHLRTKVDVPATVWYSTGMKSGEAETTPLMARGSISPEVEALRTTMNALTSDDHHAVMDAQPTGRVEARLTMTAITIRGAGERIQHYVGVLSLKYGAAGNFRDLPLPSSRPSTKVAF